MKINLGKGKAALISGPASVQVSVGAVSCLGAQVESSVIVRRDKRLPFLAPADSVIELVQGPGSGFLEVESDTIPSSWYNLVDHVSDEAKSSRQTVVITGGVDSGKTTLTVFLANRLYAESLRIAVVNLDMGQSDLGPPTTVGVKFINRPIFDLYLEKPDRLEFVGSTTPVFCRALVIRYAERLVQEARERGDVTIVNTDGWIQGPEAIEFKTHVLKTCRATMMVLIGDAGDLSSFSEAVHHLDASVCVVEQSKYAVSRTREERRRIREQSYQRHLESAVSRGLPISLADSGFAEPVEDRLLGLFDITQRFAGLGVAQRRANGKLIVRTAFRGRVAKVIGSSIRLVHGEEILDNIEPT